MKTRLLPSIKQAATAGVALVWMCSAPESAGQFSLANGQAAGSPAVQARTQTLWTEARDRAIARAINPEDYECGPTALDAWFGQKLDAIQDFDAFLDIVFNFDALSWPFLYKLFMDNDGSDAYNGVDGRATPEMVKRLKDNKRFWNIYSADIVLEGMHGADMANDAIMVPFVQFAYGVPEDVAVWAVDYVQSVIEADPGLGYHNPLFTLNAFAVSYEGEPEGSPFYGFSDKIVMGDGIMEFMADIGLGRSGPDMVMAHEFAHHVQYELARFDVPEEVWNTPEFTRATELMADAFGAYFSAHARGMAFQAKQIVQAYDASYTVGDCAFDNPGHHGTPNQRRAAAEWGAAVAQGARKQGGINTAEAMLSLFNAQLPTLIAPDAP